MKRKIFAAFAFCGFSLCLVAQKVADVYPTHWWPGMKWNKVQLMVHGDAIANAKNGFSISYPGVKLLKTNKVENSNYVFLDILIAPSAKPGIVKIH
jgi:neopullulanase